MTAIWLALILLLGSGGDASGQSAASIWNRAEQAYRSGQYQIAFDLFDRALSDPAIAQGPTLYNLGNCAYRLDRFVDAMFYYRRALLRMPRDPEATFNLRLAEQRLDMRAPTSSLIGSVVSWIHWLRPIEMLILAAALQVVGFIGLARVRTGKRTRLAMALVVLGTAGALRVGYGYLFPEPPAAMVLASEIALRSEPHTSLGITLKLEAGAIVHIAEMSDRWARVVHPRGGGWTERTGLGLLD